MNRSKYLYLVKSDKYVKLRYLNLWKRVRNWIR